jgi:hypothetical protein
MKTDRELLELAAKAAGYTDAEWQEMQGWGEVRYGFSQAIWSEKLHNETGSGYWNPLTDDGDALRLAVKLNIDIMNATPSEDGSEGQSVTFPLRGDYGAITEWHDTTYGKFAATRRAIVRAAAEIGAAL